MRDMYTGELDEPEPKVDPRPRIDLQTLYLIGVALLVLALLARSTPLRQALRHNVANVPALNAVMNAVAGQPFTQPDGLVPEGEPGGLQARAMARIALTQGRPDEAERWLVAGLADGDTADLTLFELCRLYQTQGRLDEAKLACAGSIDSAPYWLTQGVRAGEAGQTALAAEYYDLARTVDPGRLVAWAQLGLALSSLGRQAEAVPVFEHVIRHQANPQASVFHELGLALIATGDLARAETILRQGISRHPNDRAMYLALAEAYRAAADYVQVDQWYVNLLKRWPQDTYTWAKRAELAMQRGKTADAVSFYQEAVRLDEAEASHWLGLADAAAAAGNRALARSAYERVMVLRPNDVNVLLTIGRFLSKGDELGAAKVIYEHVLLLQPDNQEAQQWLQNLPARTASP